jgi:hypothetical protein
LTESRGGFRTVGPPRAVTPLSFSLGVAALTPFRACLSRFAKALLDAARPKRFSRKPPRRGQRRRVQIHVSTAGASRPKAASASKRARPFKLVSGLRRNRGGARSAGAGARMRRPYVSLSFMDSVLRRCGPSCASCNASRETRARKMRNWCELARVTCSLRWSATKEAVT